MPESLPDDPTAAALREELEATRERIASYGRLIEDLPSLYEHKFRERLQPTLARTRELLEERNRLEEQVASLPPVPASVTPPALPAAAAPRPARRPWLPLAAKLPNPSGRLPVPRALAAAFLLVGAGALVVAIQQRPRPEEAATSPAPVAASRPPAASPAAPRAREPIGPAPGELLLRTEAQSWLEVRDLRRDRRLFIGTLTGTRRFPLADGLRLSAGRPDLVQVQRHGQPSRRLGRIEEIGWQVFPASPTNPPAPTP
jgi:hypothetical protein